MIRIIKSKISFLVLFASLFELSYVLGTYAFLNTPLFQTFIPMDPDDVVVSFDSAWSIIPGVVHLNHLEINGQDPNVRWAIYLPKVKTKIHLPDLLLKKLHVKRLDSDQVTFRLDMKKPHETRMAKLKEVSVPVEEKRQKHWKLQFDHVKLHKVNQLRMEEYVFKGDALIEGGFYLWPGLEAEVGPASLNIRSGTISSLKMQKGSFFQDLKGRFQVRLDRFSVPDISGNQVLAYLNLDSRFSSHLTSISTLNTYLHQAKKVRLDRGQGNIVGKIKIEKGVFQPPTELAVHAKDIRVLAYRFQAKGQGVIQGQVVNQGKQNKAVLKVDLKNYKIMSNSSSNPLLLGSQLVASAETLDLSLLTPFSQLKLDLSLVGAKIPNLAYWNPIFKTFSKHLTLNSGSGSVDMEIHAGAGLRDRLENPSLRKSFLSMDIEKASANWKNAQVIGAFKTSVNLGMIDLDRQSGSISKAEVSFTDAHWDTTSAYGKSVIENWWLQCQAGEISFGFGHPLFFEGQAALQMKNTKPFLDFYRTEGKLPEWKYSLLNLNLVYLTTGFRFFPKEMTFDQIHLDSDSVKVDGNLALLDKDPFGVLRIKYGLVNLGVGFEKTNTHLKVFPSDEWIERYSFRETRKLSSS